MTLEDFFTLTEMRDGLTATARVRELVFFMEKEKDSVMKSSGDAIRQWAAVASSISATDNRECVDLFLQLDGLSFMNRWLVYAEKFNDDTKDGFVEESITGLLCAIDKLQLDCETSVSSGIWTTIKNLLGHHSTKVQEKARALFDSWKPREMENLESKNDGNVEPCDNANGGKLNENSGQSDHDAPPEERPSVENFVADPATNETELVTDSSHVQPENVGDEKVPVVDDVHPSQENLNLADVKDTFTVPLLSSSWSNSGNEMGQDEDGPSTVPAEVLNGGGFPDNLEKRQNDDGPTGALEAVKSDEAAQRADKVENLKISMGPAENTSSKASDRSIPAETDAPIASLRLSGVPTEIDDVADARVGSMTNGEKDEKVMVGPCQSAAKEARDTSRSSTSALDSHERELNQRKIDDSRMFFSKIRYGGTGDDVKDHAHSRNEGTDAAVSYRVGMETRGRSVVDRNRSSAELDYGIVDALEVARQVAQEVEREVVDRKERSCSSPSGRDSGGGLGQAGSPESVRERDLSSDSLSDKLPRQNSSSEASSDDDGSVLENQNAEPANSIHDMESSQVTEATQDPEDKTERGFCAFDLNQEVCSDDMDRAENATSAPVSMVSASKPAASSGLPSAPLQFEGILGWKGSAATSAFRPASPRRSSMCDKTVNAERVDSGQKLSSLKIDLNVTESGDDKVADLMLTMPIPVSSSLRSGESSVEVSSRRTEKLGLDLNRLGDDGEPSISDFRRGPPVFYHLNRNRSPSPASSSSSMQPRMRNFDLNDRPLTYGDFTEQGSYGSKIPQKASIFGKSKQDPVISILGAKVEVNKKDQVSQTLPLLNGNKGFETSIDAASITTASRFFGMGPGNPYQQQHPPMWAFNGLTASPTVSLAPAMFRPGSSIPYMLDPRGVPAVHQPTGPIPTVPFSYPQAPGQFMMSMSGPFALNGPYPGPLQPHLDLNSGFSVSDGVNRESTAVLRQFFVPDHARPTEEHIRGGLPPASGGSGIGTKRKEPDGGWEPYPISFRQQQPPRK